MSSFLKRWWWLLLSAAVCLGLWRLRFDVDVLNLLPPDEPTVQGLKLYEQHFANARELVLTLRAPDAEQAERLAGELAGRLRQETNLVAGVSWQAPWTDQPGQMGELLAYLWLNQPPETFRALTNRLTQDKLKAVLQETKDALTTSMSPMDVARRAFDPFNLLDMPAVTNLSGFSMDQGQMMFASAEGNFRLLYVQAAMDLTSYRACASWLQSIHSVVDGLRNGPSRQDWNGVVVHYTGRPVFVNEIASSMQHDMSGSVVGTSAIIALLFWLTHRRWLPMFWLLALLGIILVATLALGTLVLGAISVVSMGFAAVLLGLAVDYAVVHYQEALAHPQLSVPEIRRAIAPSILWAAITTISAFLVLNLGGLPGLGQLGTLVAIGVGLAAFVMVMIYLPPLFPKRRKPPSGQIPPKWWTYFIPPQAAPVSEHGLTGEASNPNQGRVRLALLSTGVIALFAVAVLCLHFPALDRTGDALRPQRGEAETTLDEIKTEMKLPPDPLWLIISGFSEDRVYQRLMNAEGVLTAAASANVIGHYLLPTALWPRPDLQAENRATAAALGKMGPELRAAALNEGFNTNALLLTDELIHTWQRAGMQTADRAGAFWPTNDVSEWLLKRFVARTPSQWLVMGLIYPATNKVAASSLINLSARLAKDRAWLSSWELLGSATLRRVQSKMWQLVAPMVVLVLASLWFAFRRPTEIFLGSAVLLLSGLCLLATMSLAGWSWNLLNLMALPLMLGTGVDYTIFIQLALRRHRGDLSIVHHSIGRALMLCGGTAVAGFGSLALSSNPGMASLGKVCAVGIGANMLISVFLLPAWWTRATSKGNAASPANQSIPQPVVQPIPASSQSSSQSPASALRPRHPSSFYRAGLWRAGLAIVRVLPVSIMRGLCMLVAELYFRLQRQRRQVVVENLLPVFAGDQAAAERAAHRLHRKFAVKLVDLWRVESGVPVREWITEPAGLEIIHKARDRGQGILFITLHLGNWEHGGLLLAQHQIELTVLTQTEPEDGLTELRTAMRTRLGVKTLVIGEGDFSFVEVIKRLQAGAALAIALDRPPARNAVSIELFGNPFAAPLAAAELARATGCALIGVTIVSRPAGFEVKVLPEFTYERKVLGSREARQQLTQQILRAFEPQIRKDIDQWYQFVPIWPDHS